MTTHRRKYARALIRSLFVEISRPTFERTTQILVATFFANRAALCSISFSRRCSGFADERGGLLRQRRSDKIAYGKKVAPPRVTRFGRDVRYVA